MDQARGVGALTIEKLLNVLDISHSKEPLTKQ
jgi:hypothetical protein